jgi:DNA polymerase III epsilon subunit-like protein
MNLLIFDTETTGLDNAELIEFACVTKKTDELTLQEKVLRMCPESPILPSSTIIHGITQEQANLWEPSEKVIPEIYSFLCSVETPILFVAHNITYDVEILNSSFQKYLQRGFQPKQYIDTLKLAKHLIPNDKIGGYKLDALFYYFFPNRLEELFEKRNTHSALTDCQITYEVLIELKKLFDLKVGKETCWLEVIDYSSQPFDLSDEIWKFGKHKGMKFRDTPKGYIKWCLDSDFSKDSKNSDIIYTLKKYI